MAAAAQVGHNFNAPHTASGIMMSSGGSEAFFDDGYVCAYMQERLAVSGQQCLVDVVGDCGNG
jgi:hypothetical protein